jgi:hypothetical protein
MIIKMLASETLVNVSRYTKFSLKLCLGRTLNSVSLWWYFALAVVNWARKVWVKRGPLWSPQRLESVAGIWIWIYFIQIALKNIRVS